MRKLVLTAVTIAAALLVAAPNASAITSSTVTSPASPTFLDPDLDGVTPLTVSGTASGTGNVDIRCVIDGGASAFTIAGGANVPVSGGAFSASIDVTGFSYYICRVVAVPAGVAPPYNLATFQGPVVSNGGFQLYPVTSGPSAGKLADYYQAESALEGYWSVYSAGNEVLGDSYALDPSTFSYTSVWDSTTLLTGDAPPSPSLRIDGRNAYPPDSAPDDVPGYEGIQNFQHSIDGAAGGVMRVSDTEPLMVCEPDDGTCSSVSQPGLRLEQSQVGGTSGHTLEVRNRFVNTSKTTKQLDATYDVEVSGATPGWRFPGDSAYTAHAANDTFTPAGPGPASFFVIGAAGGSCADLASACGSLTWYQAPNQIKWAGDDTVQLTYTRSIPAGGSAVIALNYSQGYPQASVDGYAAAAEKGFQTSFTIGKLTRNKKKGTATLALDVPAAGTVHLEGKNLKTADLQAAGAGTVTVPIKATGKAKKKLKKKGKAKVNPALTYTNTGLDPTSQSAKVLLKRKHKRKHHHHHHHHHHHR